MKNFLRILFILLFVTLYGTTNIQAQQGDATDITFTDLDGNTYNLFNLTSSGYRVILNFASVSCGPCQHWAENVGEALWQEYGPNGDNSLRIFHIDYKPRTDETVSEYIDDWEITYPVVNLQSIPDGYNHTDDFSPRFYICTDNKYFFTGGGGYSASFSMLYSYYFLDILCEGYDLNKDVQILELGLPTPKTLCESTPLYYSPRIYINRLGDALLNVQPDTPFYYPYDIEIFINGEYHSTQTHDPAADGSYNSGFDETFLDPIPVNFNDKVLVKIDFPGDNFPYNDTMSVIIPSYVSTPTSTTTKLSAQTCSDYSFQVYDSNGALIHSAIGYSEFELEANSCYQINFSNIQQCAGVLKDFATGEELIYMDAGEYAGYTSPGFYFNVISTSDIEESSINSAIKDSYFLNLLGKRLSATNLEDLPKGVYLHLTEYENGKVQTKKVTPIW
ncbi:MAG: hypothetical protein ISP71_05475 [Flavobacteriales bacterium]|nr:hypothetical protein [Flavobacteriales bacterium]